MSRHEYTGGECADLLHVVMSVDADEPGDGPVVWGVLPNHAAYVVAEAAIDAYAEETAGVEIVWVVCAAAKTGEEMRAATIADIADMQDWSD